MTDKEYAERYAKIVAEGSPKEPSAENPGPYFRTMVELIEQYEKDTGKEAPAVVMVGMLAHLLDVDRWRSEVEAYNRIIENHNKFRSRL